jgi:hypothetical protein
MRPKVKPAKDRYGVPIGWGSAPVKLSDAQARAFDILGMVGGGIYNCPIAWKTVGWLGDYGIKVSWHKHLATYDFGDLTRFVFLCHAGRMRGGIMPGGPGLLNITLTQRKISEGVSPDHHPNLAEAVAAFERYLPHDHSVRFVDSPTAEMAA